MLGRLDAEALSRRPQLPEVINQLPLTHKRMVQAKQTKSDARQLVVRARNQEMRNQQEAVATYREALVLLLRLDAGELSRTPLLPEVVNRLSLTLERMGDAAAAISVIDENMDRIRSMQAGAKATRDAIEKRRTRLLRGA